MAHADRQDGGDVSEDSRCCAQNERVLFHYNGHGVPRPTANGEIWVFNKSYTQYIPMSIYDLQAGPCPASSSQAAGEVWQLSSEWLALSWDGYS